MWQLMHIESRRLSLNGDNLNIYVCIYKVSAKSHTLLLPKCDGTLKNGETFTKTIEVEFILVKIFWNQEL